MCGGGAGADIRSQSRPGYRCEGLAPVSPRSRVSHPPGCGARRLRDETQPISADAGRDPRLLGGGGYLSIISASDAADPPRAPLVDAAHGHTRVLEDPLSLFVDRRWQDFLL
jgi:hypothetical protein